MLDKYDYRRTFRVRHPYCFSTTTVVTPTRLNVSFIRTLSVLCPSCYRRPSFSLWCPFTFACSTYDFVCTTLACAYTSMLPNSKQILQHVWNFYLVIIFWETFPFSRSTVVLRPLDLLTVAEKSLSESSGHEETFCYEDSVDIASAMDMWNVILLSPFRLIW